MRCRWIPWETHAFVLGVVAFVFAEGAHHRGRVVGASRCLFVVVASVLATWLYLLRILPFAGASPPFAAAWGAFPTALWTALASLVLYPTLDKYKLLDDLCGRRHAFSA